MKLSLLRHTGIHSGTRTLSLISLLALGFMLGACQPSGVKPGGEGYTTERVVSERAEDLINRARQSSSPQREQLLIEAADLLYRNSSLERAQQVFAEIDKSRLNLQILAQYSVLGAEMAMSEDNFFTARSLLIHPALEQHHQQMPLELQQKWHQLRADLFSLLGEEQRSIDEYIALSTSLAEPARIRQIHDRLWQVLSRLPQNDLDQALQTESDRVTMGWYTLTSLSRNNPGDITQLQKSLASWRQNWAWHPAAIYPPEGLDAINRIAANLPKHLALLLPLTHDKFGAPSKTLLDGFMASYYDVLANGGTPPSIKVYDTSNGQSITTTYQQAVTEGAQLVIGPLDPTLVKELNNTTVLSVPTVTLNYLPDDLDLPAQNLYQFGVTPADEAKEVAQRAWLEGHRTVVTFTPNSDLGDKVLTAFTHAWEQLGGMVLTKSRYPEGITDYKNITKQALLIDQNQQRTNELARLLGKRLVNEPLRRRQDVDMIFLHASPNDARLIKPTLDYYSASDLPVYATSWVYTGKPDPARDNDLNGIRFTAMPWALPGSIASNIKPDNALHQPLKLLFALGVDAYRIHQGVLHMQTLPSTRLPGITGTLLLDPESQEIIREHPWAEFRHGRVRAAKIIEETE